MDFEPICKQRTLLGKKRRQELPDEVRELFLFDGCKHLLRGTALATVMSTCAKLFKHSNGSSKTYELSREVDNIDVFLSHNWCVSRLDKYLALTLHFNFRLASLAMAVCFTSLGLAILFGGVPDLPDIDGEEGSYRIGYAFTLGLVPLFVSILFWVRDIHRFFGFGGPIVFLDKACIHQENREVQRQGIEKLAAYLHVSQRMVVLYTDEYLRKLWTIYEVAAFLSLKNVQCMDVVPIRKARVFYWMLLGIWLVNIVVLLSRRFICNKYEPRKMQILIYAVLGPLWMHGLGRWFQERAQIKNRLNHFRIAECVCFDERDKPIVLGNIANMIRNLDTGVAPDAPEAEALRNFDALVCALLPEAFHHALGKSANVFSYAHCIWFSMFIVLPVRLDSYSPSTETFAGQIIAGSHRQWQIICYFTQGWVLIFVIMPVALFFMQACASLSSGWSCRDAYRMVWYMVSLSVVVVALSALLFAMDKVTEVAINTPWVWSVTAVATVLLQALVKSCLFREPFQLSFQCPCMRRRQSPEQQLQNLSHMVACSRSSTATGARARLRSSTTRRHNNNVSFRLGGTTNASASCLAVDVVGQDRRSTEQGQARRNSQQHQVEEGDEDHNEEEQGAEYDESDSPDARCCRHLSASIATSSWAAILAATEEQARREEDEEERGSSIELRNMLIDPSSHPDP